MRRRPVAAVGGQLWFGVADANNTHSGLDHIDTDTNGYDVADHPTSGGNIASMAWMAQRDSYFAYGRDDMLRSGHITNDIENGQASEIQETDMVFGSGARPTRSMRSPSIRSITSSS